MADNASDEKEIERPVVAKSAVDLQRLKLAKLMKNPDKPVLLPERPKSKNVPSVPEFVRNVMGSSAGAGSGEFHVYRHLRRKEYSRQKFIQEKCKKEILDEEYHKKLEEHKLAADALTAKKRAKRLKKKQKQKQSKKCRRSNTDNSNSCQDSSSSDDDTKSGENNDTGDDESSTRPIESTDRSTKSPLKNDPNRLNEAESSNLRSRDSKDGEKTVDPGKTNEQGEPTVSSSEQSEALEKNGNDT